MDVFGRRTQLEVLLSVMLLVALLALVACVLLLGLGYTSGQKPDCLNPLLFNFSIPFSPSLSPPNLLLTLQLPVMSQKDHSEI